MILLPKFVSRPSLNNQNHQRLDRVLRGVLPSGVPFPLLVLAFLACVAAKAALLSADKTQYHPVRKGE